MVRISIQSLQRLALTTVLLASSVQAVAIPNTFERYDEILDTRATHHRHLLPPEGNATMALTGKVSKDAPATSDGPSNGPVKVASAEVLEASMPVAYRSAVYFPNWVSYSSTGSSSAGTPV